MTCGRTALTGIALLILILYARPDQTGARPEARIFAAQFSKLSLSGWQPKRFNGQTRYDLVAVDQTTALRAQSDGSASGLIREIEVDLEAYPFLNWRWKVVKKPAGVYDETEKGGDDYAARVYIIHSGGIAVWNTRALNYVWSKHSVKGAVWNNAYAGDRAVMIAARSSVDPNGKWMVEKRNIREDFRAYFGEDIKSVSAVAVMTDSDDTGTSATAFYGDIFFSRQ